ncbi:MAG: diaminopimelate epimerase, partial [Bacteroidota bacterium]
MQNIPFHKYQGTGNDFIIIDQRQQQWLNRTSHQTIRQLCDRHFGIGADGLILLENHSSLDFEMIYFNSDGQESSMCGNGGRCVVAFAHAIKAIEESCQFMAIDGIHSAYIKDNWVELRMSGVHSIRDKNPNFFLHTGSPHHVLFVDN